MGLGLTAKDVVLLLLGIAGGGALSYHFTRTLTHRPRLIFDLHHVASVRPNDFSNALTMTLRGQPVENLVIFRLEIALHGKSDIVKDQIVTDKKPSLKFPHFRVFDVRTLNNDESRFEIPLGIVAPGNLVVVNINHLRSGTRALFQIIGTFDQDVPPPDSYEAAFFPGVVPNVNVETRGSIARPWKKVR